MKLTFHRNMGKLDRVIRTCLGITFLAVGLFFPTTTAGTILLVLSIPLLGSGITGFCPTYVLLGVSTLPKVEKVEPNAQRGSEVQRFTGSQPLGVINIVSIARGILSLRLQERNKS